MASRVDHIVSWRVVLLSLGTLALLAGTWTAGRRYASQRRLDSMLAACDGAIRDMANQLSVSPRDPLLQSRLAAALNDIAGLEGHPLSDLTEALARRSRGPGILWAAAAHQWASSGNHARTAVAVRNALKNGDLDKPAYCSVGSTLLVLGKPNEAFDNLLLGLGDDRTDPDCLWFLVRAASVTGNSGKLVALFSRNAQIRSHVLWKNALVEALVADRQYGKASSLAEALGKSALLEWSTSRAAAYAALQQGDTSLAERFLSLYRPGTFLDTLLRALLCTETGKQKEALDRHLRNAVWRLASPYGDSPLPNQLGEPAVPSFSTTYHAIAQSAVQGGQVSADGYLIEGVCNVMLGDRESAVRSFRRALAKRPGAEPASTYLATGSLAGWSTPPWAKSSTGGRGAY